MTCEVDRILAALEKLQLPIVELRNEVIRNAYAPGKNDQNNILDMHRNNYVARVPDGAKYANDVLLYINQSITALNNFRRTITPEA